MIDQRINLYQDRFRPQRLLVSANQLVMVVLVAVIGIVVWSYLAQSELNELRRQQLELQSEKQLLNQELTIVTVELNRLLADTRIDDEIKVVSRAISARKKILRFVETNQFGSGLGFSHYLLSLSRLQVKNIWLDHISLAANYVKISGSSLSAEAVPVYFSRFSNDPVFQGQQFNVFQIDRDQSTDWKVDFEIATDGKINE